VVGCEQARTLVSYTDLSLAVLIDRFQYKMDMDTIGHASPHSTDAGCRTGNCMLLACRVGMSHHRFAWALCMHACNAIMLMEGQRDDAVCAPAGCSSIVDMLRFDLQLVVCPALLLA
jgi:hypothetical protein